MIAGGMLDVNMVITMTVLTDITHVSLYVIHNMGTKQK